MAHPVMDPPGYLEAHHAAGRLLLRAANPDAWWRGVPLSCGPDVRRVLVVVGVRDHLGGGALASAQLWCTALSEDRT